MIYFHGGGWVIGNLETEDRKLRHIVDESGVCVLSVDYVLAPEHPFPGPGNDCIACVRDALNRAGELGIDPDRIFLGGASAGANLALVAALALRDAGIQLAGLLLFYGAFDLTYSGRSMDLLKSGYFLETEAMYRFRRHYCPEESNWRKPEASPLFGNFQGLPRTFISAPTVDPLFNDSTRLADLMEAAGVKVDLQVMRAPFTGSRCFRNASVALGRGSQMQPPFAFGRSIILDRSRAATLPKGTVSFKCNNIGRANIDRCRLLTIGLCVDHVTGRNKQ